jgi:hypothetical protein
MEPPQKKSSAWLGAPTPCRQTPGYPEQPGSEYVEDIALRGEIEVAPRVIDLTPLLR